MQAIAVRAGSWFAQYNTAQGWVLDGRLNSGAWDCRPHPNPNSNPNSNPYPYANPNPSMNLVHVNTCTIYAVTCDSIRAGQTAVASSATRGQHWGVGVQVKLTEEPPAPPLGQRLRGVVERELRGGRRREVSTALRSESMGGYSFWSRGQGHNRTCR